MSRTHRGARGRLRGLMVAFVAAAAVIVSPTTSGAVIGAEEVAGGLNIPVTFDVADDGTFLYGERFSGEIRWFDPADDSDTLFVDVGTVGTAQEQGLINVALHPNYPATPYVYAFATRILPKQAGGTKTRNQLLRYTSVGGVAMGNPTVLFVSTPGPAHNGGRLHFGPDGKLYMFIGNHGIASAAQDRSNPFGKVLRLNDDGTIPNDNPFVGQEGIDARIFSYGMRNGIGLATDPVTGKIWQTEAGSECNDEINRLLKGRNFGWGENGTCVTPPKAPRNTNQDGPNPVLPAEFFKAVVTPTGLVFCDGCGLGAEAEGTLFVGSFNDSRMRMLVPNDTRRKIVSRTNVYSSDGAVLSVEAGPDGTIYFSDNNQIMELTSV
ncbi:MAG: PQQ-dependent sugar dehydrogenase [Actinomycetota bacterium]